MKTHSSNQELKKKKNLSVLGQSKEGVVNPLR